MQKQIQYTLPRSAWEKVVIVENNEPLVEIQPTKKLILGGGIIQEYDPLFWVRETVAEKLYQASSSLPDDFEMVLIEGYRTMKSQQKLWDSLYHKIQNSRYLASEAEVERMVRMVIAKPSPLANHHCAGAIDVTLRYKGEIINFGTPYLTMSINYEEYKIKFPMLSEHITDEQLIWRKLLRDTMTKVGFVWYPGEWWHYCYGDRMWAVYTEQTTCMYGPAYTL